MLEGKTCSLRRSYTHLVKARPIKRGGNSCDGKSRNMEKKSHLPSGKTWVDPFQLHQICIKNDTLKKENDSVDQSDEHSTCVFDSTFAKEK